MKIQRFNWHIWAGFLLSVFAFFSYPTVFVEWPPTRDFPWANLLLFAVAGVLLFFGIRRAVRPDRGWFSKIGSSVLAALSVVVLGLFILTTFVASKWLPQSGGAPQVGQKATDFTLADTNGKQLSLTELLSTPVRAGSLAPRGVLLIFYRGYW